MQNCSKLLNSKYSTNLKDKIKFYDLVYSEMSILYNGQS